VVSDPVWASPARDTKLKDVPRDLLPELHKLATTILKRAGVTRVARIPDTGDSPPVMDNVR
jgi:hypothetical protein